MDNRIKNKKSQISRMLKIKIKQTKSGVRRPTRQRQTLQALGLTKMNSSVELEATPQILGMINKVNHLVTVEKA